MDVRWFGQSAFLLTGSKRVAIDPFGPMEQLAARGLVFDYPPVSGIDADLVLITHEHADHNAADVVGGSPTVIRSTAGTLESPIGTIVAIASEHDGTAGTQRGPNTIFCFELDGFRLCHFGDFGQATLRLEQRDAIGEIDVLFLPVGGGPTIGGAASAAIVRSLEPRLVVPMHYRTKLVSFLDPPDAFLEAVGGRVDRLASSTFAVEDHLGEPDLPVTVLPAPP